MDNKRARDRGAMPARAPAGGSGATHRRTVGRGLLVQRIVDRERQKRMPGHEQLIVLQGGRCYRSRLCDADAAEVRADVRRAPGRSDRSQIVVLGATAARRRQLIPETTMPELAFVASWPITIGVALLAPIIAYLVTTRLLARRHGTLARIAGELSARGVV